MIVDDSIMKEEFAFAGMSQVIQLQLSDKLQYQKGLQNYLRQNIQSGAKFWNKFIFSRISEFGDISRNRTIFISKL